jgi:hypothetical protein
MPWPSDWTFHWLNGAELDLNHDPLRKVEKTFIAKLNAAVLN